MKTTTIILTISVFLSACVNTDYFKSTTSIPNPPPPPPETHEPIPIGGLPEGMKWQLKKGPDFYIHEASNERSGVMMYIGRHPNFTPATKEEFTSGRIGSEDCQWIRRKEEEHDTLETLIQCPLTSESSGVKLHAVIWGPDEDITAIKESLRFVDFGITEINKTMEGEPDGGHNSGSSAASIVTP